MSFYDQFTTRAMLEGFAELPPISSFLRDMFFSRTQTFPTQEVQVDFFYGKQRMAPFVARYQGGRALLREGFQTQIHVPPRFAPERVLPAEDLMLRGLGQAVYVGGGVSPQDVIAQHLTRDREECEASIVLREEWMCAQVLTTGGIAMKSDGGGDFAIIYAPHVPANTPQLWTAENSDPLADLALFQAAVRTRTGINPDVAIMDRDAGNAFLSNAKVLKWMNFLNARIGAIEPVTSTDADSIMLGRFLFPNMRVYIYDQYYLRPDPESFNRETNPLAEVLTPMLSSGTVIVASSTNPGTMVYGGIAQIEPGGVETVYQAERVPLLISDVDNQVRKFRLSSRPLPVPSNALGYAVANVLGHGETDAPEPAFPEIPRPVVPEPGGAAQAPAEQPPPATR